MKADLNIQNKKIELIQWLSTVDDIDILDKISEIILKGKKKDWWDIISEDERMAVEKGIKDADENNLNPHSKAREIYGKWL